MDSWVVAIILLVGVLILCACCKRSIDYFASKQIDHLTSMQSQMKIQFSLFIYHGDTIRLMTTGWPYSGIDRYLHVKGLGKDGNQIQCQGFVDAGLDGLSAVDPYRQNYRTRRCLQCHALASEDLLKPWTKDSWKDQGCMAARYLDASKPSTESADWTILALDPDTWTVSGKQNGGLIFQDQPFILVTNYQDQTDTYRRALCVQSNASNPDGCSRGHTCVFADTFRFGNGNLLSTDFIWFFRTVNDCVAGKDRTKLTCVATNRPLRIQNFNGAFLDIRVSDRDVSALASLPLCGSKLTKHYLPRLSYHPADMTQWVPQMVRCGQVHSINKDGKSRYQDIRLTPRSCQGSCPDQWFGDGRTCVSPDHHIRIHFNQMDTMDRLKWHSANQGVIGWPTWNKCYQEVDKGGTPGQCLKTCPGGWYGDGNHCFAGQQVVKKGLGSCKPYQDMTGWSAEDRWYFSEGRCYHGFHNDCNEVRANDKNDSLCLSKSCPDGWVYTDRGCEYPPELNGLNRGKSVEGTPPEEPITRAAILKRCRNKETGESCAGDYSNMRYAIEQYWETYNLNWSQCGQGSVPS